MSSNDEVQFACQEIIEKCVNCGRCVSECKLLQDIGEDLISLATRQPTVGEAYSCTLCGLCEGVCPLSLSPRKMFVATRHKAVDEQEIDIDDYKYMFPDRELNVMKMYREVNKFDYKDLKVDQEGEVAFFPGCTLLTYDPKLIYAIVENLEAEYPGVTLITDCCGIPLYQLGLRERGEKFRQALKEKLRRLKVKSLILACSNCYYQLKEDVKELGIRPLTIYEALSDSRIFNTPIEAKEARVVTVHDSCPDRFAGIFARQARQALAKKGYVLVEMEHNSAKALCCGSGGQASHFAPELARGLVEARLEEVTGLEVDILASYCLGCVLNLSKDQNDIPVQHVLNLLLDLKQDFAGLKKQSKTIFEGPEGEKLWERIMAD
ncbi:(Fe-S)-binding protein [Desulfitobacterium sp. THU1]